MPRHPTFLLLLLLLFISSSSSSLNIPHLCSTFPNITSLPSNRLTLLISSHHPSRIPFLHHQILSYSSLPFISSIIILHSNPSSLPPPLPSLPNLHLLLLPSPSLNLRFLPLPPHLLLSRFLAISDDDILPSNPSLLLSLALSLAPRHPLSLLGFFPRSHALHLPSKSWLYALHHDRYSILLTKLVLLRADYLHKYSCREELAAARAVVDRERNCEDILMNFVAAMESGEGPVLVGGGRVRDFGDKRNGEGEGGGIGLSYRKEHWERRGWCINEFHRLLGVMPLRYSYGKVVGEIGEQGVCRKDGRLVFCDQD